MGPANSSLHDIKPEGWDTVLWKIATAVLRSKQITLRQI